MKYETSRVYEKRETEKSAWSGRIGHVTFAIDSETPIIVTLDGVTLPPQSVEYLMNFALQALQDAYAGAASMDEAKGNWAKKRQALLDGTMGQRSTGVDEAVKIGRRLAEAAFVKKYGKDAWPTDSDEANAKADEILAKNAAAFTPLVMAEIERLAVARREKAAIAAKMGELSL